MIQKTISGGERKRTAIGVELITDPSLILLDEPTSGLDSFKALTIVKLLKKLARQGKTIISTIHQPSSESFNEFDRLLLMSDGHCVYQGEAALSAQYFRDIGFELPTYSNPADTYMRILAIKYLPNDQLTEKDSKKTAHFVRCYERFIAPGVKKEKETIKLKAPNIAETQAANAGICKEFTTLVKRNRLGVLRDPL